MTERDVRTDERARHRPSVPGMAGPQFASASQRRDAARHALEPVSGAAAPLLRVRCAASHHVAEVRSTDLGPVFSSRSGRRAHGRRDDVDLPHGNGGGADFVDLLDAGAEVDDELPASCGCGPRHLSRTQLQRMLDRHERLLTVP